MDFPHFLQPQGQGKELTRKLEFQDRFDILLKMRLSGGVKPFDKLRTGKDIQCYMGNPS